ATVATESAPDAQQAMQGNLAAAEQVFKQMQNLIAPKLLPLPAGAAMFAASVIACSIPAAFQQPPLAWLIGGVFAGAALFVVVRSLIKMIGTRQMLRKGEKVARLLDKAEAAAQRCREHAEADFDRALNDLKEKHVRDQRAAQNEFQPRIDAIVERRAYLQSE